MTQEQRAQMAAWYQAGQSLTQIGTQVGLSPAGVRYHLLQAGIPIRSRGEGMRARFPHGNPATLAALAKTQADRKEAFRGKREQIAALYQSGLSLRQVGARIGLTIGAVRSALLNAGVTPRGHREGRALAKPQGYRGQHAPRWTGGQAMSGHVRQFVEGERVANSQGVLVKRIGGFGPESLHWQGGTKKQRAGRPTPGAVRQPYLYQYAPTHPHATKAGYVMEHRLVAEQKIGRLLATNEVVHHINGNRLDNRPENLEVMTRREHVRLHFSMASLVAELRAQLARYQERYGDLETEA